MLAATGCRSRCPEITGPSRRGRLVGVMCRTFQLLCADFFAFRFVSDFRRRQPIVTIQEIFSDGSSETKWLLGSKRNALPKRAGKPPEGSRRNLRDTAGEKKCQESRHGQRQKTLRATGRAPVPPAVRRSGGCRRMSPCPARGIPVPVLRIRSGRSRRRSGCPVLPVPAYAGGNTVIAGAGPCADGAGDAHGSRALHPAARSPGCAAPLLTTGWPDMRAGTGTCSGLSRRNCATPGFIRTDVGMPVADDRIDMCRTGPPCNATAGKAGNDTMDSPALPAVLTGSTQEHSIQEQESGRKLRACTLPQTGSCTRAISPLFFPLFFSLNFRRNPGETGWQHTDRTASHTAGFVPCRFEAVLCGVISGLKIDVSDRDALSGRIYPPDTPKVSAGVFHHPFRVFRPE